MSVRLIVDSAARMLLNVATGLDMPCAIGRGGAVAATAKCEGDGATPLGDWPLRAILLRPDRIRPSGTLQLPWRRIDPADGWSDDPADPAYNRPVRHPHRFSAERLWRTDGLYDVIVVLGHNDDPPEPGRGSAIFLHIWNAFGNDTPAPTEGCVAIAPAAMNSLFSTLRIGDSILIR